MADVLLINMWTNDVGRYGASNYGLLKVIFEVNLKLFDQKSAKKLLFVLRDFDDRGNNGERIKIILENDIRRIWSEIFKPEPLKDSKPEQFFQFEFAMMPHKIFEEQKFYDKAKELRNRFEVKNPSTLFLSDAEQKNIPIDGMPIFIERSWTIIRNQKELNLPDQRDMVANYRCNEIKEEAEKLVEPKLQQIFLESSLAEIPNFSDTALGILSEALQHYQSVARQYTPIVANKIQLELADFIKQQLYLSFDNQMKVVKSATLEGFKKEVQKLEQKNLEDIVNSVDKILSALLANKLGSFERHT